MNLSDEDIERIWYEAECAAEQSSPYNPAQNPYAEGSDEWDIWEHAYRHALFKDWH